MAFSFPLQQQRYNNCRRRSNGGYRHGNTPNAAPPTTTTTTSLFLTAVPSSPAKSRSIPKEETDILQLWQRMPRADGRGIKIAILGT